MQKSHHTVSFWGPRVLGILMALFIAVFALDSLHDGPLAFAIHLIPALFLLLVVALAWRWEWIGAVVFPLLAVFFTLQTVQRTDSGMIAILAISGPLLLVGLLFFWNWRQHQRTEA